MAKNLLQQYLRQNKYANLPFEREFSAFCRAHVLYFAARHRQISGPNRQSEFQRRTCSDSNLQTAVDTYAVEAWRLSRNHLQVWYNLQGRLDLENESYIRELTRLSER